MSREQHAFLLYVGIMTIVPVTLNQPKVQSQQQNTTTSNDL